MGCVSPTRQRLGPEGGGWAAAMTTLMNERMAFMGLERPLCLRGVARARAHASGPGSTTSCATTWRGLYGWVKSLELLNARVMTKLGREDSCPMRRAR